MNRKLSPSLPPPVSRQKRKNITLKHEQICMKTSHEDYGKVIKNTGNLDTINISATNERKESAEQSNRPARHQKME